MVDLAARPESRASIVVNDSAPPVIRPEVRRGWGRWDTLRAGGVALSLAAGALIGFLVFLVGLSGIQEARTQDNLYKSFRGKLANAVAPVGPVSPGSPVALLEIPRLHIRQVVVEGTTGCQLTSGPGHRRDTPLPGQAGVSVILGRRSTFGAPFRRLPEMVRGEKVVVTTGQGIARYRVVGARTSNDPAPVPLSPVRWLNLVTADPQLKPSRSLIVTAELESSEQPSPGSRGLISPAERSLAGDTAASLPLVLWGQALLLAAAAATVGQVRWSRRATYLLAVPVLLAVMWNVYENLARLLPNTL